jgi:pimeloyl-ACP methyl ester carboxylesterase
MTIYKILKWPFFGRFMVRWQNPLSPDHKSQWHEITTSGKSGGLLKGLFAKSITHEERATIVLGHPMGKDAKGYFLKSGYADFLRANGFNVLVFDINGFGESTHGNFSYYEDIVAMGKKAVQLTPTVSIGYHGVSLGGQWATIAFTDGNHPYKFAIVESAATTLEDFWINFPVAYSVLRILNVLMPAYRKKIRMVDRIKEVKHLHSLLLIYSYSDELTPVAMGEKFQANSGVETELWTVRNAKHAAIMKSEHKAEYLQKVLEYFTRSLSR